MANTLEATQKSQQLRRRPRCFLFGGWRSVFLFEPPVFEKTVLFHIMNTQKTIAQKLLTNKALTDAQNKEVETLSPTLMLCYLNGFDEAKDLLFSIQNCLRDKNAVAYQNHKDAMRILRKIKYN